MTRMLKTITYSWSLMWRAILMGNSSVARVQSHLWNNQPWAKTQSLSLRLAKLSKMLLRSKLRSRSVKTRRGNVMMLTWAKAMTSSFPKLPLRKCPALVASLLQTRKVSHARHVRDLPPRCSLTPQRMSNLRCSEPSSGKAVSSRPISFSSDSRAVSQGFRRVVRDLAGLSICRRLWLLNAAKVESLPTGVPQVTAKASSIRTCLTRGGSPASERAKKTKTRTSSSCPSAVRTPAQSHRVMSIWNNRKQLHNRSKGNWARIKVLRAMAQKSCL